MESIINWLNGIVWSSALVYLILGVGLFYSIATRFFQFRHFKDMIRLTFKGDSSAAGVSSFQALSMSVGSRAGIGNIAGVATAITFGGPGAIFWMWVMAFLSASTSFIETTLAQVYKSKQDGEYRGGAPYYIGKGLNVEWYGILFAFITMISMTILVPGIQVNTIALSMESAFGFNPMVTGAVLVVLLGAIIFGGVKRIATTAQIIVPFMAIGYFIVCALVLLTNISQLPNILALIFSSAFSMDATFGGLIGSALAWGVQRGAFSNAAGFGSETFESGAAEVSHPAKQGLVQALSVYIDTLIICSATGFMILLTGMYNVVSPNGGTIINNIGDAEPGSINAQLAIESVWPGFGAPFVAIAILFFAFTSIITYSYKAETSLAYINRNRKVKLTWPLNLLKIGLLVFVFYSSTNSATIAWEMGDLGFGIMTWLNIAAILLLTKPALKVLKDYEMQKKEGKDPVFNPTKLGIKGADFWEKEYEESPDEIVAKRKTM
ncbi:alanine/glycine:cation symporter family protein [Pseudalkalibacillus salsuginis]|uniref:alanine/glycine:cation symporter family protein n=1 Tax=Pseudalkalibacillus salsuginis TaxID=2910972 RepID=UPI001F41F4E2|nr:alanine/glycine:cation symporter family protein [Pseudalkalibacillus salsuginis]MCF6409535.1 alanine:cation symporter family protein [Pseudalkalibacillus salsuginis]